MAYTVATAVVLAAFWACPNVAWMQWLLVAGVGFALYGPQMLIGLCGAEVVPKPSVSAANGMLGWISYLGAPPAAPWSARGRCTSTLGSYHLPLCTSSIGREGI